MSKLGDAFEERLDRVKSRAKTKINTAKTQIGDSNIGKFASDIKEAAKAKGTKAKIGAYGRSIKNGIGRTKLGQSIKGIIDKIVNIAKKIKNFFKANWFWLKWVLIAFAVVLVLKEAAFFGIATGNSLDPTPHYYCNYLASDEEKSSAKYKQYCVYEEYDNASLAASAVSLATVDISNGTYNNPLEPITYHSNGTGDLEAYNGVVPYTPEIFISVVPQIIQAMHEKNYPGHTSPAGTGQSWTLGGLYASCDFSVCMAVLWSGADDNYPTCLGRELDALSTYTANQTGYLLNGNHGKWRKLEPGEDILPGDIAVNVSPDKDKGHVWMYVAKWTTEGGWEDSPIVQAKYPGSHANRYEGSHEHFYARLKYTNKSPWDDYLYAGGPFYIFRFVGTINEESPFIGITP